MSKADAAYQRACDRVRREIRESAPKQRFSKALLVDKLSKRLAHRRYDFDSRQEHAWASDGASQACLTLLAAAESTRPTKAWLRAFCLDAINRLEAEHGLHRGNGTAQTWGKGEAVANAYGQYREYLDIIELAM